MNVPQHCTAVKPPLVKVKKVRASSRLAVLAIIATLVYFIGCPLLVLNNSLFPIAFASPDDLTLRPNAAGTYQSWSTFGNPPSHWQGTSDQNDATGVQVTGSTTLRETVNLEDTAQTGTINSVRAYMRAKATGSSTPERAVIIWRTYNTNYESGTFAISRTAFTNYYQTQTTNPATGQPWTWEEINALEIGSRASTLGFSETIQVSEYWIVVDYTPGYSLNLRVMDWDLTDAISEAYVYMNSEVKVSDSNGWANWSLVTGTVQVKVRYYGFWVNGTFLITMDSDKTIYVRCNLYDVVVDVRESIHNAKLIGVNVTVFNSTSIEENKIKSGITDFNGQVLLTNLPNNTLTFTQYGGSEYTIVIGNATQLISSEDYSFTVICNQNYVSTTSNYAILVYMGSFVVSHPLNKNLDKKLSKRIKTNRKVKG